GSGEYSDFQSIIDTLETMYQTDLNLDDGYVRNSSEIHNYLRAIMYQKRNKGNPLWNQLIVGGFEKGKPFLGYVFVLFTL
ncbi:MAG: hypothetical protein KA137_11070, partial [Halioglobus sp.]|nr:hypothetical protein [Halioglobus sp.]